MLYATRYTVGAGLRGRWPGNMRLPFLHNPQPELYASRLAALANVLVLISSMADGREGL